MVLVLEKVLALGKVPVLEKVQALGKVLVLGVVLQHPRMPPEALPPIIELAQ